MERGKRKNVMQNFVRLSIVHLQFSQCAFFTLCLIFLTDFALRGTVPSVLFFWISVLFACLLAYLLACLLLLAGGIGTRLSLTHTRHIILPIFANLCIVHISFASSLMKSFHIKFRCDRCKCTEFSMFANGVYSTGICFGHYCLSMCLDVPIAGCRCRCHRSLTLSPSLCICGYCYCCFCSQSFCFRRFKTTLINNYGKFFNS